MTAADQITDISDEKGAETRSRTRARLAEQFHVEAEYVQVPKLARILGLAPSTIYTYIRTGSFFLPYRLLNKTVAVKLDDVADWLESSEGVVAPFKEPPQHDRVRLSQALHRAGRGRR